MFRTLCALVLVASVCIGPARGAGPTDATLRDAVMAGDATAAAEALADGADPDVTVPGGRSVLVTALTRRDSDMARMLIEAGADVNLREPAPGRSPLQLVIDEAPSPEAMSLLLDGGADIDQADFRGETALASAAFMNRPEATRLLIERGAALDVVNANGVSPLEWARRQGNAEVVAILEAAGAS